MLVTIQDIQVVAVEEGEFYMLLYFEVLLNSFD